MTHIRKPLFLLVLSACFLLTGSDRDLKAQVNTPDGYYLFGGPAVEQGRSVAVMPDGSGFVIAGDIRENDQEDWDIIVIRLDNNCRQVWQRRIGGPGEDHNWGLTGTRNGGVVISGATSSFGANGNDIFIVRLKPDGTEAWRSLLGGPGDQGRGSVLTTAENELVVAGWSRSGKSGDFYAAKLTCAGKIVWERTYDHWYLEGVNDIATASDGSFLLYGEGIQQSGGETMNGQLVVIDAAGDLKKRICLPDDMYREGYGIAVTSDEQCAVTGPARTDKGFRAYVTGFDRTGSQIWSGYYPADNWAIGFGICAIRSGGFCQTGWSRTEGRGSDAVLVKIDEDGSQLWIRHLGGAEDENGIRVVEKPAGGFLIVGTTGSFGAGGGEDILLINTDAEGHPINPRLR
jgi:hypothetical protein